MPDEISKMNKQEEEAIYLSANCKPQALQLKVQGSNQI